MRIAFLVTSHGISGGHGVLFEHAYHLAQMGHEVELVGRNQEQFAYAYTWHDRAVRLTYSTLEDRANQVHYTFVIATNFDSVFCLPLLSADYYCFFMQANESAFFGDKCTPYTRWLEDVCNLRIPTIVCAQWLRAYLSERNGTEATVCRNGIRKDLFLRRGPRTEPLLTRGIRVLVEGPLDVIHKNVLTTLDVCLASLAQEAWLLTSSPDVSAISPRIRAFSSVPISKLGAIYRSCDVLVKLSTAEGMFGPPLEMFHCGGTAICYDIPGHEEYLVDGVNGVVVPTGDTTAVLNAIDELACNSELLGRLKEGARQTAEQWSDWELAGKEFERCLTWASTQPKVDRDRLFAMIESVTRPYLKGRFGASV